MRPDTSGRRCGAFQLRVALRTVSMDHAQLVEAVLRNPTNRAILERLPALGLADAWLVSGAVFQTVWNVITGRPPDYGIKDYDIFYFDADTSFEAEDAIIRRVAACLCDVCDCVEARNQARVHLWYPEKFRTPYGLLLRTTEGIDRFLARVAQVGVQPTGEGWAVYAPHGLDDVAMMTVRPNPCPNFRADIYDAKAASWKIRWPELTIVAATEV
jgi:hypothetical protein